MTRSRSSIASLCLPLAFGATAFAQEADTERWMKFAHFIVGVYNVEDMIQIPGTRWIIGSGLTTMGPGMADRVITKNYLHLFDAETETGDRVEAKDISIQPDTATYPDCTTPPDWDKLSPHGIGLGAREGDVITLYATNHGPREAVEIFKIDVSGEQPKFAWIGCVPAPEDGFVDAVAWIPGTDGIVVTSLLDPRDPGGQMQKSAKGEPVGWVREWHPGSGWATVPGTESLSAPNGVIASADGRYLYVAVSTSANLVRVTRGGADPEVVAIPVNGLPDNARWSADGETLLVAVHTVDPMAFAEAAMAAVQIGANLETSFNVTRIKADLSDSEIVIPSGVYGVFGAATTAIEVGDRLWVGSAKSDRIAIFDLNKPLK